jgi:ubiquinone biosynthesis protein
MRKNKNLVVPKCYQDLSNRNILVMELLEGDTLSSWQKRGDVSADDKKRLAGSILSEVLQQIFADGDFHGDPHGGNFIVMKDGRLGMIDLGLTGDLDSKGKAYIIKAMKSILAGDPDQALRSLLSFGVVPEGFDYLTFKESVGKVFSSHRDNVKQNGFEPMISDLFRVSQQHGLYIPTSTTVLIKSLVTIDGLARSLDPEINVAAKSIPIVLKGTITSSWQGSLERLKRFVSL